MPIVAQLPLQMDAGLEREVMEALAPSLAALLDPLCPAGAARDRVGLLVASPNAGAATSLRFWAAAQRTGLALASPELFPWCLANAPCGALSRHLRITGPNFTFLGAADALAAAIEAADDLLRDGRIDLALVVALAFADPARPTARGLALVMMPGDSATPEAPDRTGPAIADWP